MPDKFGNNDFGVLAEHTALRDEILSRIKMRQQVIAGTLALAATFLGVGLTIPIIVLVYPPLAAFLALAWAQNDYRIRDIAKYLREEIEPRFTTSGWESTYERYRLNSEYPGAWRYVVMSHGGLLLFTQSLALFVGLLWLLTVEQPLAPHLLVAGWVLVVFDAAAILGVWWCIAKSLKK